MKIVLLKLFVIGAGLSPAALASELPTATLTPPPIKKNVHKELVYHSVNQGPYFDLPVTYNSKVQMWISYYQNNGKKDFTRWLERSYRYIPKLTPVLEAEGLPRDLVYLAMIESGFSPTAESPAAAVGYWQFIKTTAHRYGLTVDWWLDERRDVLKSTVAAANYLNDLYKMFGSWYLAAAAYNTGEGRIKNLIKKYKTKNYWALSKKPEFPQETEQYIPKLIAAMLIAKAPQLYGFRNLKPWQPMSYDTFAAPGGTDLDNLAYYLGTTPEQLKILNPEILKGFVPTYIKHHKIRIPRGMLGKAKRFAQSNLVSSN